MLERGGSESPPSGMRAVGTERLRTQVVLLRITIQLGQGAFSSKENSWGS